MSDCTAEPPAPTPTGVTWISGSLVFMLVLAAIINYLDRQALSVVSPTLKHDFHLSNEQWGAVNSAFSFVYIFSTFFGGMWIDRIGVRKGLMISIGVWSVAAAGHAFAHDFWSLCFWRMFLAVGEGPGASSLMKGVRRLLPPHLRDSGTAWVGMGSIAGALLVPFTVGPLVLSHGWQASFFVTGSAGLLWMPFWAILVSRSKVSLGGETIAMKYGDHAPAKLNLRSLSMWATLLTILFAVPPSVFVLNFLALYFNQTFGVSQQKVIGLMWQPYLAMDFGQLLAGFAVTLLVSRGWKFFSARRLIISAGLLGSALLLMMNYSANVNEAMMWLVVGRFMYQGGYIIMMAHAMECVPESQTALMHGLMNSTFGISNVVINLAIGKMADVFHGYKQVVVMSSLSPLIGLIFWLVFATLHTRQLAREGKDAEAAAAAGGTPVYSGPH